MRDMDILKKLLDKYENSQHFYEPDSAKRRILLKASEIPGYKTEKHEEKEWVHTVIVDLHDKGWVQYEWLRFEEGNLLERIWLEPSAVDAVYAYCNRTPKRERLSQALHVLQSIRLTSSHEGLAEVAWIFDFVEDVTRTLTEDQKFHRYWPDQTEVQILLAKTLNGLLQIDTMPIRLFSSRYLGNSKAFEKQMRSRLLTIVRAYTDWAYNDEAILSILGIERNPEEVLLIGDLSFIIDVQRLELGQFPFGTSLNSRTIEAATDMRTNAKSILTIENKAVYYEYVKTAPRDQLVIYLGGFFGKTVRVFLEKLRLALNDQTVSHWGDVDLGGFMIYDYLKRSLEYPVRPYRMDVETLLAYEQACVPLEKSYRQRLETYKENHPTSVFHELITVMLSRNLRLEQEMILVDG